MTSKDVSLDWFQYLDSMDGLVHDVRRYATTSETHVSRCRQRDPMYPPEPVEDPVTCLLCIALRGEVSVTWEPGIAVFNTRALKKITFNY